jgi:hypothetical protein
MKVLIHTSSATSTKFQEKGKKKEKQNPFKKAQYNSYFYDFSFYLIISYSFSQKNNSRPTTNSIISHVEKKGKIIFLVS